MSTMRVDSPIAGLLHPLSDVPDPVFAEQMLGPGVALMVSDRGQVTVYAPLAGHISALQPHAFFVEVQPQVGVLVHLGLDTYRLDVPPFASHVVMGQRVDLHQPVVTWDLDATVAAGIDPWVTVSVLGLDRSAVTMTPLVLPPWTVASTQPLMELSGL